MVQATVLTLCDRPDPQSSLAAAHRDRDEARSNGPDIGTQIAELEEARYVLEAIGAEEPPSISRRAYAAEDLRLERTIERLRESEVTPVSSPAIRRIQRLRHSKVRGVHPTSWIEERSYGCSSASGSTGPKRTRGSDSTRTGWSWSRVSSCSMTSSTATDGDRSLSGLRVASRIRSRTQW